MIATITATETRLLREALGNHEFTIDDVIRDGAISEIHLGSDFVVVDTDDVEVLTIINVADFEVRS